MSQLLDALLSVLSGAGAVLDTPGSVVRNTLAGENPFKGLFDPEERTTGREMLQSWGMSGENDPGKWFEAGDFAGFGMELATDPLNLMGLGAAKQILSRRVPTYKGNSQTILDDIVSAKREELADPAKAEMLFNEMRKINRVSDSIKSKKVPPSLINSMETAVRDSKLGPSSSYYKSNLDSLRYFMPDEADEIVGLLEKYPANIMENLYPFQDVTFDLQNQIANAEGLTEHVIAAQEMLARMKQSPELGRIAERVPPGSTLLGAGAESMALKTPAGDVFKIHGKDVFEGLPQVRPPQIPEVLQPNKFVNFDEYAVGRYPLADTSNIPDDASQLLSESLTRKGYPDFDVSDYNIGMYQGRPVVIDAGAIGYPEGMRPPLARDPSLSPLLAAILGQNSLQTAGGY